MADFTGMTVQVTLKEKLQHNPSQNVIIQGRVQEVVPGQVLALENVFFPHNGWHCDTYSIRGPTIADLQVMNTSAAPPPPPPPPPPPQQPTRTNMPPTNPPVPHPQAYASPPVNMPLHTATGPPPQRQPSTFVDPAILSYGRSPVQRAPLSKPPELPSTPIKSMLAKAAETLPANSSPFIGEAGKSSGSYKSKDTSWQASGPRLPSSAIPVENVDVAETQDGGQFDNGSKKKPRRSQKKKQTGNTTNDPPLVMNVEVSRNGNDMNGGVKRGKGWRQTPLLQPSPQTDGSAGAKKSRGQNGAQQNGWATEDATDIQDMGDFDFEANHKLFDKKQVFDELRQGDTTADEDRLVGHNKVHRPGTYGGKNLHPTENVLSPQLGPKHHSNEGDSSSDADTELNFVNGRSSSRHSVSRVSTKRQPSRQNSTNVDVKPHPLSASMSSDRGLNAANFARARSHGSKAVPSIATSPMPGRAKSPQSAISTATARTPSILASHTSEPHFILRSTMTSCPVLLPHALETLETETVARYGLTHDAITETAARQIAETAMSMFDVSNSRRGSRTNTIARANTTGSNIDRDSQPVVVIIAGNHALGARAVAAARHLVSRKTKVIVAEAQYESPETQDVQIKAQLAMLKRMVKGGANIKRGPWRRASGFIKNLSGPPAVIIDALLAGATYDSLAHSTANPSHAELAQKEAREMIDWANRSRAPVLSVGCPSGVSGTDGSAPVVEGEPLAVRPERVLALGAPMQGLLDAKSGGERWVVSVADVGINIALRSEEAVAFGRVWVGELGFVGSGNE